APDAPAVLRRAGAASADDDRVGRALGGALHLLHHDVVLPVVAEVVVVAEASAGRGDPGQLGPRLVLGRGAPAAAVVVAVTRGPDDELVEVSVIPAHCHLDGPVELAQGHAARDLEP